MTPLVRELTPPPDPVTCVDRLAGLSRRVFLDSAATGARLGRYSFVAADPVMVIRSRGGRTWIETSAGSGSAVRDVTAEGDALAAVRRVLAPTMTPPVPGLPPFQGGVVGYVAYDWGLTLERLPAPRFDDLDLDDVVFGVYDWVLAWDHAASKAWLVSTGLSAAAGDRHVRATERADAVMVLLTSGLTSDHTADRSSAAGNAAKGEVHPAGDTRMNGSGRPPVHPVAGGWWGEALPLGSSFSHRGYLDVVSKVREYIYAGDIFQANISQRFEAPLEEPAWSLYQRLRRHNPAPFAAFLDLPGVAVVSASPERFLQVDPSGHVETRPIKGTRARGFGPEHDAALAQALTESAKDRAENLMIVDLMRNDLSRVCLAGSVRVSELFTLERYATVHHLVSTVVGDLAPGADALDLLRAAFPGGSITGAPKLRAMEIIAECEPSRRGVYCGCIGYWSLTGALDTSIAIRTAVVRDGRVYFSAGGGIVADSVPEQEYRETLDKARATIDVLAAAP
jgi:para-aminobenzoate synthetase component 1